MFGLSKELRGALKGVCLIEHEPLKFSPSPERPTAIQKPLNT